MVIAESDQADRKRKDILDWFSVFKKTILNKKKPNKPKNKAMLYAIYRTTAIYNPTAGIIAKVTFEIELRKMMEEINNSSLVCFVSKPSPLGLCSTERLTRPHHFLCGSRKTPRDGTGSGQWDESSERRCQWDTFFFVLQFCEWARAGHNITVRDLSATRARKQADASILAVEPAGIHSEAIYRLLRDLDNLRDI